MEQPNTSLPAPAAPAPAAPPEPAPLATWPRCVQLAVAILIALGIGFLLGRSAGVDPARRGSDDSPAHEVTQARLDLNHASRAELELVHGLGPSRAQAIVDYRQQHGRFKSVDDLRNVAGIGPKTLEKVRSSLLVREVAYDAPPDSAATEMIAKASTPSKASAPAKAKKAADPANPINVNQATAAELRKLPGIGDKMSQRIVDERSLRGPFKTVDDLRRVPGIGPKTLEKLRPYVIVDAPLTVAGS